MSKNKQTKGQPAEFNDDEDFEVVDDHDYDDAFVVKKADPAFHYFLAADDGDKDRPDGVFQCMLAGYEECTREYATGGTGCKLLRIPRRVFDKRQARRRKTQRANADANRRGVKGVPDNHLVHLDNPAIPVERLDRD